MVSKEILNQYSDLRKEIKELQERIAKTEKEIEKMENEGAVCDTVSGGAGGMEHFRIEGFPYPQYDRKKKVIK